MAAMAGAEWLQLPGNAKHMTRGTCCFGKGQPGEVVPIVGGAMALRRESERVRRKGFGFGVRVTVQDRQRVGIRVGTRVGIRVVAMAADGGEREGVSASRRKRVEKAREERERKRGQQPAEYPNWAKVLEEGTKDDEELREILGNSIGDPEKMLEKVEARLKRKSPEMFQPKKGAADPMKVYFHNFDPADLHIWIDLYAPPTEEHVEHIGSVIRSWYVMGHLGAFNSTRLQLSEAAAESSYSFSPEKASEALPSMLHNIGELEFQDNIGRVWVDLGTTDALALDALINSFITLSSDYVGIKCLVFGGDKYGEWEEGMTREEDGYVLHKI